MINKGFEAFCKILERRRRLESTGQQYKILEEQVNLFFPLNGISQLDVNVSYQDRLNKYFILSFEY